MTTWKWIRHEGQRLYDIGVNADGSLHNPNGYDEDLVRAACAAASERRHKRASDAAKKAAETRRRRQMQKVYEVADRIVEGHIYGPRSHCYICGKGLGDPDSIERGIGSDCWQFVLGCIEGASA